MYWEQTAAIRIGNELNYFQKIERGVRQGCVLSPDLFSLYSETIMQHVENIQGILVGGYNVNNTRYADDTILMVEDKKQLQSMLNIVVEESEKKGHNLNGLKQKQWLFLGRPLIQYAALTFVEILLNKSKRSNIWEQF